MSADEVEIVTSRNIAWDSAKDLYLLKGIQELNAHVYPLKWRFVINNFCSTYPEYSFMLVNETKVKTYIRRLKNRYVHMREECIQILENGNLPTEFSSPELKEKFELMKLLIDQVDSEKKKKLKLKELRQFTGFNSTEDVQEEAGSASSMSTEPIIPSDDVPISIKKEKKRRFTQFTRSPSKKLKTRASTLLPLSSEDPIPFLIQNVLEKRSRKLSLISLEPSLQLLYNNRALADVLDDGKIKPSPEILQILESIGIEGLLSIYCAPCYEYHSVKIRDDWKSLGIDPLTCAKLFLMFEKSRRLFTCPIDDKLNSICSSSTSLSSLRMDDFSQ